MSGRALSCAHDIVEFAERAAVKVGKPNIKFRSILYGAVADIVRDRRFGVYIEPTDEDSAHTNLVLFSVPQIERDASDAESQSYDVVVYAPFKDLADILQGVSATDVAIVEALRCGSGDIG